MLPIDCVDSSLCLAVKSAASHNAVVTKMIPFIEYKVKVAGVGVPITCGCSSIGELSSLGAYGFSGHVSCPGGGKTQSFASTSLIGPSASFKLPGEPCTNGLFPHRVFRFLISSESDVGVVIIIKAAARTTIPKATL